MYSSEWLKKEYILILLFIDFGIYLKFVQLSLLKCNYLNFFCYNVDFVINLVNRDEDWEIIIKFCE